MSVGEIEVTVVLPHRQRVWPIVSSNRNRAYNSADASKFRKYDSYDSDGLGVTHQLSFLDLGIGMLDAEWPGRDFLYRTMARAIRLDPKSIRLAREHVDSADNFLSGACGSLS